MLPWPGFFLVGTFLSVALKDSGCISASRLFKKFLELFFHVIYPFDLFRVLVPISCSINVLFSLHPDADLFS